MRRALAIVENSLPDHHPWVVGARNNLADLLAQRVAEVGGGTPRHTPKGEGTPPAAPAPAAALVPPEPARWPRWLPRLFRG